MSAALRRHPAARFTPDRWWPHWPAGSTRGRTAGAGWCASKTWTRRAARVVVLHEGRVAEIGPADALLDGAGAFALAFATPQPVA
jgi:hypothetical protein